MIKNTLPTFKKILIIGSGALKIGEAGEFDYSGGQALKALKEEGIHTVLINPNIATVQTSDKIADTIYFLPVTPYFVEKVIEKEKPDGVLLAFGGQTALNCGVELFEKNVFEKNNVQILGTPVEAIIESEDREAFRKKLESIEVDTARSITASTKEEATKAVEKIGFPVIVRAAYALGGLGSGFANNHDEFDALIDKALSYSPQVIIDESLKGWKEIEYEVVRDKYNNCITVCNMENFDPIGVHTGESIVIAPSQTLTNSEYHLLREVSIRIARSVGIVGECNVQFALSPNGEDYRVIEINARLSRSSALASKATGYPLAFVAAKLALGYGLHELKNSVTKTTPAFFEPALDYVVCKFPRWDMNKFFGVSREIGSSMKSVGEVMSIGVTFEESFQKGLRMLDNGLNGFINPQMEDEIDDLDKALEVPTDTRVIAIEKAFNKGYTVDQIHDLTKIDTWFLSKLERMIDVASTLSDKNLDEIDAPLMKTTKQLGFSDLQIASLVKNKERSFDNVAEVRTHRKSLNVLPAVRQIDTLAAEYPAQTNYLYVTYHAEEHNIEYENDGKSVITIGSGVYRIGSSVEFDWCCVNALKTINKEGFRSVMINYNPETVSTDYDECDRLYFEELTLERVLDIADLETPKGVIVSMGGQIPNTLSMKLHKSGVNILGTSPESIDRAENRYKFSDSLDKLGIGQPKWKELSSKEDIDSFVEQVGFPVLIRPSYVLSGAAMNIVSNQKELDHFLGLATKISPEYPVVVSDFIQGAKEIELDAVAKDGIIVDKAISEHIEFAGVHSGDATIVFPPQNIYLSTIKRIIKTSEKIAKEFNISGPFNMQYLAKGSDILVIECNLRASRSFPFVSKVAGKNMIDTATKILLGKDVEQKPTDFWEIEHVGVKASQFSFTRLQGADPVLGVDMSSTGEVGCIGEDMHEALLKSMISVGHQIPKKKILISTGNISSKVVLTDTIKLLKEKGFELFATKGTHDFYREEGIESTPLYWPDSGMKPNVLDIIKNKEVDLVINIPKNLTQRELDNDYLIRRAAVDYNIPLLTNARLARAYIDAFCKYEIDDLEIKSWNEYL